MPGQYSTGHRPSWDEAVNEEGAVNNVLVSAGIVVSVAVVLLLVGLKVMPKYKLAPLKRRQQRRLFIYSCTAIILLGMVAQQPIVAVPAGILLFFGVLADAFQVPQRDETGLYSFKTAAVRANNQLLYDGAGLNFTTEEITTILSKHFPYFLILLPPEREKFIKRLQKFIRFKTFVIHDTSGFKEMPVLISASAIQLSFGLKKYLIPTFSTIHIYPDEFINSHQSLRIVIGNVSNNCINISWKHFLNGFQVPDGVNVGLHEMAHAYHYQNFASLDDMEDNFVEGYKNFAAFSNKALLYELSSLSGLYTLYGLSNEQEFWAESVELFFEKPVELQKLNSELFSIISGTLNQEMFVLKPENNVA